MRLFLCMVLLCGAMLKLSTTPIKADPIRVVMVGQSNMVGYGNLDDVPYFPAANRVKMVSGSSIVQGQEPTHSDGYASCGMSFGTSLGGEVILIPVAVGGTYISEWQKGGSLYSNMVNKIAVAGGVDAMIFYQGEADAVTSSNANNWATRFASFVDDIRADYGNIPIIFAQLATEPVGATNRPYWSVVKSQQDSMDGYDSKVKMITTDDLVIQTNDVHLTTASQIIVGQRFAYELGLL